MWSSFVAFFLGPLVGVLTFAGLVLWFRRYPQKKVATPRLRKLLTKLPEDWNREDFILCGSASLAFRGIRDVRDLDILVRPQFMDKLQQVKRDTDPYADATVIDVNIDVFTKPPRLDGLTFDDIRRDADFIDGYYVQSLRHTLAIKALVPTPREKDKPDMVALAELIAREPAKKGMVVGDYRTGKVTLNGAY